MIERSHSPRAPLRGDIWAVNLEPVVGHEQGGTKRPALVVSSDAFNRTPLDMVVMIPLTTVQKTIVSHVPVDPPEGGLKKRSYIRCEDIRSISTNRLIVRWGGVSGATMRRVCETIRLLLEL